MEAKDRFHLIKNHKNDIEGVVVELRKDNKVTKIITDGFAICDRCYNKGNYRYYTEFTIREPLGKKGIFTTILMNPSERTCPPCSIEPSIQNAIKIAYLEGYEKVVALHIIPYIDTNSDYALNKCTDKKVKNMDMIKKHLARTDVKDVMAAWGLKPYARRQFHPIINALLDELEGKNVYTFCRNLYKINYPKHTGRISIESCSDCKDGKLLIKYDDLSGLRAKPNHVKTHNY